MAHTPEPEDDIIVGINVVPLVDIVLVLLIVFMVTATFINRPAIDMELPSADTGEHAERTQFSLLLGKNGEIAIGDQTFAPDDTAGVRREMERRFEEFKRQRKANAEAEGHHLSDNQLTVMARSELTMVIQADREVTHGRIIWFIDQARQVGVLKYAFDVDPATTGVAVAQIPRGEGG